MSAAGSNPAPSARAAEQALLLGPAELQRDRVVDEVVQALDVVLEVAEQAADLVHDGLGVELVEHAGGQRGDPGLQLVADPVGALRPGREPGLGMSGLGVGERVLDLGEALRTFQRQSGAVLSAARI